MSRVCTTSTKRATERLRALESILYVYYLRITMADNTNEPRSSMRTIGLCNLLHGGRRSHQRQRKGFIRRPGGLTTFGADSSVCPIFLGSWVFRYFQPCQTQTWPLRPHVGVQYTHLRRDGIQAGAGFKAGAGLLFVPPASAKCERTRIPARLHQVPGSSAQVEIGSTSLASQCPAFDRTTPSSSSISTGGGGWGGGGLHLPRLHQQPGNSKIKSATGAEVNSRPVFVRSTVSFSYNRRVLHLRESEPIPNMHSGCSNVCSRPAPSAFRQHPVLGCAVGKKFPPRIGGGNKH